mgnify:CR=1 FL=1
MNAPVICTIIAKNYLAHARCLTESFLKHHPDGRIFVLLVDRPDGFHDFSREPFTTLLAEDIGIPEFGVMTFRYTMLELSTAVKPFLLSYLFRNYDYDAICYFDPDIYFYHPIDDIWDALRTHSIVLTPHLTGPLNDGFNPDEQVILRAGAYNLGFIGLSRHPELEEFLTWWQSKLVKYCIIAFDKGLFVDQRWIDLAAARFAGVYVHRDPGCNVAYWNLYHRRLECRGGEYTVNGSPLKFFHFSGYSPDRPNELSKFQDRYTFENLPQLKPLFDGYRERLLANGYDTVKNWPYAYSILTHAGVRIPDAARYLWREIEIQDPTWNPFSDAADGEFVNRLIAWLNEPVDDNAGPLITRLALGIHQQQSDLRKAFPDVLGRDRVAYARWYVTSVERTFMIDPFFVRPMAESLQRADLGRKTQLYQKFTHWLFSIGVGQRIERLLGQQIVGRIRNFFIPTSPDRPMTPVPLPAFGTPPLQVPAVRSDQTGLGVNVVGYLRDETGVGENVRAILRALHAQNFPVAWTLARSEEPRQNDCSVLHLPQGHPYTVNLLCVNADQLPTIYNDLGADFFAGKYNIGYWHWELEHFPEQWHDRFQYLNEIWVASRFVQGALAQVSPIPVVAMGIPISRYPDSGLTRAHLGLPEGKFVFLLVFDMLSYIERKNPYGLIEAYRRAFGPHYRDTVLVIKVTKLDQFPEHHERLRQAVASVSGILLDGYMDRPELSSLFLQCDAYVSLHRSEGFGLTMAEAMAYGKPVIATAYSGNTDFMNVSNSYPVAYRIVELEQDYGPYQKGSVWAEPDLDHAAAQLRYVFEHPDEARRTGARAATDIELHYSSLAIARKMIERVKMLAG